MFTIGILVSNSHTRINYTINHNSQYCLDQKYDKLYVYKNNIRHLKYKYNIKYV